MPVPPLFTRTFIVVWVASLLYSIAFQLTGAALPLYAAQLGATDGQVGLVIGLFALAAMLARTVVGWQLDRGRKKPVLLVGNLIFLVSAVGYGLVGSVGPLLGLRFVNGVGHAAGQAANQTLATETAPAARRGEALAMQLLTLTLALGTMPALGVWLATSYGFSTLFAITAGCSALATLVALLVAEPPASGPRPMASFFNRGVSRPGTVLFALMLAFGAVIGLAPVHAARAGLINPGLFFVAYAAGLAAAQSFGGRLTDRRGRAVAILPGLALASVGLVAVALTREWWLLPAAGVFGLGVGLAQGNLIALGADSVPAGQRGSAIATAGIFLEAGISVGATVAGLIGQAAGLGAAFLVLAAAPAVALIALAATPWGSSTLAPGRRSAS